MLEFKDKVDYYIDGGTSKLGKASTVIKVVNNKIEILRIYGKVLSFSAPKNYIIQCTTN